MIKISAIIYFDYWISKLHLQMSKFYTENFRNVNWPDEKINNKSILFSRCLNKCQSERVVDWLENLHSLLAHRAPIVRNRLIERFHMNNVSMLYVTTNRLLCCCSCFPWKQFFSFFSFFFLGFSHLLLHKLQLEASTNISLYKPDLQ